MNPQIKQKWIEALRSGKYKQTTGRLHRPKQATGLMGRIIPEGYCCLGVLCELAAAENVVERHVEQCGVYYSSQRDWLPVEVVNWAGLKSGNPSVNELQLSVYNDRGASFTIIADLIEKHL